MKTYDILHNIYYNRLTDQQANIILEQAYEDFHAGKLKIDPREYTNMTYSELTLLLLYSLPYSFIAKWRYEGWPTSCAMCDKPIDADLDGWSFSRSLKVRGVEVKDTLTCLKCADVLAGIFMKRRAETFRKLHKKIFKKR